MKRASVPIDETVGPRDQPGGRDAVVPGIGRFGRAGRLVSRFAGHAGSFDRPAETARSRGGRPPLWVGAVVTVLLVIVCTVLVYPLKHLTTVSALGVVYLVGVVIVSTFWGLWMGVAMSVLSAAAFNFFHLPPLERFTIRDSRNWVALGTFLVAAVVSSWVGDYARSRSVEAERRRAEADLTAEMAQLLLGGGVSDALPLIGQRLSAVFQLPWVSVSLDEPGGDARGEAIELVSKGQRVGTLVIPAEVPVDVFGRLRERVVPALAAVLAVALDRERLVAEAVQTEGLRRSEAIKTAVLRAVSHDLRSPVTAMVAAGAAVRARDITPAERDELGSLVVQEGARLSRLIDDLLDLSKLEANATAPRVAECSVAELIDSALAAQPADSPFEVHVDSGVESVRADFAQVERALANLFENASRFSGSEPVAIRARRIGKSVVIRVVDRGPGVAPADRERIFEPFYRGSGQARDSHAGSGLGLAIAKGFIEANGGRIWVESTPGAGAVFAVSLRAIPEPHA
jgi:two-component system, OmpR family, sensor histidine kinase KdpD